LSDFDRLETTKQVRAQEEFAVPLLHGIPSVFETDQQAANALSNLLHRIVHAHAPFIDNSPQSKLSCLPHGMAQTSVENSPFFLPGSCGFILSMRYFMLSLSSNGYVLPERALDAFLLMFSVLSQFSHRNYLILPTKAKMFQSEVHSYRSACVINFFTDVLKVLILNLHLDR
jgi:hypothetical protein